MKMIKMKNIVSMPKIAHQFSSKVFVILLVMLFLVSSVFAANVAISPNPAHDNDALTCSADGKTNDIGVTWKVNGKNMGMQNPLPASLSKQGDSVTCEAYLDTPFGSKFLGKASVVIQPSDENHRPSVAITSPKGNSAFNMGENVNFRASGYDQDKDVLTYTWNFGDGRTATGSNVNHVFTREGNFVATVNVRDAHGATGTDSVSFRVAKHIVNHAPTVQITYPQMNDKFTAGSAITFVASASDPDGDSLAYMWDFGDGATSSSARPVHTYANDNYYKAKLTITDGKLSASSSVNIAVIKRLYDIKGMSTYSDAYSTPADVFYRGDALYAKFFVMERATNKPVPNLDVDAYIYNAQSGSGRIVLSRFSGTADGRIISNGEPLISKDGSYYFKLDSLPLDKSLLGKDIVFVIAYHLPNGGGQDQKIVEVLNNPIKLDALPDVSVPLNGVDASLDLDNYVSDKETPKQLIKWAVSGNKDIAVSINPLTRVVSFSSSVLGASERITFTANDGDGSFASRTLNAKVVENTAGLQAIISGGDKTVFAGNNVVFDGAQSKGGIASYTWNFGDGSYNSGRVLGIASHVYQTPGEYVVTLTVSGSNKASSSASIAVHVMENPNSNNNNVNDNSNEKGKYAYLHGSKHNFNFDKVIPLYYKPSYKAGTAIPVMIELVNSGFVDEALDLDMYIGQSIQPLGTIYLASQENKHIQATVYLPGDLTAGTQVAKVVATNNQGGIQKTGYVTFVVTH